MFKVLVTSSSNFSWVNKLVPLMKLHRGVSFNVGTESGMPTNDHECIECSSHSYGEMLLTFSL